MKYLLHDSKFNFYCGANRVILDQLFPHGSDSISDYLITLRRERHKIAFAEHQTTLTGVQTKLSVIISCVLYLLSFDTEQYEYINTFW